MIKWQSRSPSFGPKVGVEPCINNELYNVKMLITTPFCYIIRIFFFFMIAIRIIRWIQAAILDQYLNYDHMSWCIFEMHVTSINHQYKASYSILITTNGMHGDQEYIYIYTDNLAIDDFYSQFSIYIF